MIVITANSDTKKKKTIRSVRKRNETKQQKKNVRNTTRKVSGKQQTGFSKLILPKRPTKADGIPLVFSLSPSLPFSRYFFLPLLAHKRHKNKTTEAQNKANRSCFIFFPTQDRRSLANSRQTTCARLISPSTSLFLPHDPL